MKLLATPGMPQLDGEPVFAEPWQAQAFAMTLALHQRGLFTWPEWADALSRQLAADPGDDGTRYYDHWVAALEGLVMGRKLARNDELEARKAAWKAAYLRTPHGKPVEL